MADPDGVVSKSSTDAEPRPMAEGTTGSFAARTVEDRGENNILMCKFRHRIRFWLMVSTLRENGIKTRLYFGSAVTPVQNQNRGELSLGLAFNALAGWSRIYSEALSYSAKSQLKSRFHY